MLLVSDIKKLGGGFLIYLILATGKVTPIGENALEIVVGFVLLTITLIVFLTNKGMTRHSTAQIKVMASFLVLLLFSTMSAGDLVFAYSKIEGAIFVPIAAASVGVLMVRKWGEIEFARSFVFAAFGVLLLTIVYRYIFGLTGREGRFFLNGPIVFGWLMGFSSLLSLLIYYKDKSVVFSFFTVAFFAAVLWSQSKGPLLGIGATAFLIVFWFGIRNLTKSLYFIFSIVLIGFFFDAYVLPDDYFVRYSAIERYFANEITEADSGSLTIRSEMWSDSVLLWLQYPIFGAGLGGWAANVSMELKYPHNFIFESLSETGVLGLFILLATIIYCVSRSSTYGKFVVVYFAICLSFSGDASYLRFIFFYPLVFVALSAWSRSECFLKRGEIEGFSVGSVVIPYK